MSSIGTRNGGRIALLLAAGILGGCISGSTAVSDADRATSINPATTQPGYWYSQPEAATANNQDFDQLWESCAATARDFFFEIDVQDYRGGVLITEPLVSAQWFEPWRGDTQTLDARTESSLATIRRTIRFEFTKADDGAWRVSPKVLVERQSIAEKRITSVILYRNAFLAPSRARYRPSGTTETDLGIYLPERYWYPVERDTTFEAALVRTIEQKLSHR